MSKLELKPAHKLVQNCSAALRQFDDFGVSRELLEIHRAAQNNPRLLRYNRVFILK